MIVQGDCLEVMRTYPDNHFSAIVCDPPYGLHFMSKDWDKFKRSNFDESPGKHDALSIDGYVRKVRSITCANTSSGTYDDRRNDEFEDFMYQFGKEALRICKPGAFILMCGAPRRFHRQACGLEDAGWEIRDCISWLYGQGFPKSHNHFGLAGYGTALKPAWEPIIMAMKPCEGTFAQNAEKWGQAGINIDGCRIGTERRLPASPSQSNNGIGFITTEGEQIKDWDPNKGRWPANLILDEEAAEMLDQQSGISKSSGPTKRASIIGNCYHKYGPIESENYDDSGGASRFFYCAKASSSERNRGCEGLSDKVSNRFSEKGQGPLPQQTPSKGVVEKNNHPTVKPLKLMEYLIKLIAPPSGALILDPFAGSGTTLIACKNLGVDCVGIEKSADYCEIAKARLSA